MTKRNLFLTSLFVSGCLWGSLLTTDAEVILEGPGDGAFGFAMSAVHGDWDTTPDVAVGAPMQDSVFVFTDVATGTTASSSAAVFEGDGVPFRCVALGLGVCRGCLTPGRPPDETR